MYSSIGIVAIGCGYIGKKGFNSFFFFFFKKKNQKEFQRSGTVWKFKATVTIKRLLLHCGKLGGSLDLCLSVFLSVCLLMC